MSKRPLVDELRFLKLSGNHLELSQKLMEIGVPAPDVLEFARFVCEAWFHLGEQHLAEASKLNKKQCARAVYSRSYYAAYNVSKATRYLASGHVSLKGDDHGKAIDLPGNFPDTPRWSKAITTLYEHRLRADYDNWVCSTKCRSQIYIPQQAQRQYVNMRGMESFRLAGQEQDRGPHQHLRQHQYPKSKFLMCPEGLSALRQPPSTCLRGMVIQALSFHVKKLSSPSAIARMPSLLT